MDKRNIIIIIIVLLIILLKLIDKEEFLDNSLNDIVQDSSAIGPPGACHRALWAYYPAGKH